MGTQRRKFSREFKLEAVRLVKDRGVAVAQAARDLDLHENVLRKWVRETNADRRHAFPGHGLMKPEQQEIDRLRKEVAKLKAERDILKRPQPTSRGMRYQVRLHREAPGHLAGGMAVQCAGCIPLGLPCLAEPLPQRSVPARRGADFGEAVGVIGGVRQKIHFLCMDLPQPDACFVKAYPRETTEAFLADPSCAK